MKHFPNMAEGLCFEEEGHIYTYNNIVVPCVSDIIKPLYDFSGVSDYVLQNAAERGTEVHFAIEKLINYGYESHLSVQVQKYFDQFRYATDKFDLDNCVSEVMGYNPALNYAGTMDIIVHLPNEDAYLLIDIKTSSVANRKAWSVQTTAYNEIAKQYEIEFTKRLVLQLAQDSFKWIELPLQENVFLSLWNIYNFVKG